MCITKNDLINEVAAGLVMVLSREQIELVKATFLVKMQGHDIHEVNTLPSVEVKNNDFILKRFTVDMLAKGLKESSIKAYMTVLSAINICSYFLNCQIIYYVLCCYIHKIKTCVTEKWL